MRALRCLLASLPLLALRARLALVLHVAQLLLAIAVLLPLSRAFEATFGSSVVGRETGAGRFVEFAWQDWRLVNRDLLALAERAFSGAALLGTFLSFTLLSAGTFALLAQERSGSSVREFLAGAGRLFARFTRLFLLFAGGCVALYWANRGLTIAVDHLVAVRLDRASSSRVIGVLLHLKSFVALLLLAWLIAATGLAKARAAVADERSMVRAFLAGWRSALTRPIGSALLAAGGPLMIFGSLGAYAWLRDRIGAGASTELFSASLPTWIVYLAIAQLVGWLMQGTTIVWTNAFVLASRRSGDPMPGAGKAAAATLLVGLAASYFAAPRSAVAQSAEPPAPRPFNHSCRIVATLDPNARTIEGTEEITFTNVGAAPIDELVFHLYMNAFSRPETVFLRERRIRTGKDPLAGLPASALGSCVVSTILLGEQPLQGRVEDTVLRIALPGPVAPAGRVTLSLAFVTKLASMELSGRGGFFGDHIDGMQWFPKLAALRGGRFDDEPFHADTEFFGDFGSFDVTLVVPSRFVVGATGRLVEEQEAPAVASIPEPLTRRRYLANAVHDFAWCADPHFVPVVETFDFPARSVAITYLCQPYALEKSELVLATTRLCLERYAEWFEPYPYDTLTIDGEPLGMGGGMEYPTLFTISQGFPNHVARVVDATEEPAGVTAHEFGHQYWYGLLASDEPREAWLDEGLNTYVTTKIEEELWRGRTRDGRALQAAEWIEVAHPFLNRGLSFTLFGRELGLVPLVGFESSPFTTTRRGRKGGATLLGFPLPRGRAEGLGEIRFLGRREDFVPVAGKASLAEPSFDLHPGAYAPITYGKTTLALATLEAVFGWNALRPALREYVRRHRFSHPSGEQFLAVLREEIPRHTQAVGVELEPYLREMWKTDAVLDLAVAEARSRPVRAAPGSASAGPVEHHVEVLVENRGTMRLTAPIRLCFADGSEQIERWPADRRFLQIDRVAASPLVSAEVDPDHTLLLDVDWSNNGRTVERNDDVVRRFDAAALFWIESALTLLRTLTGP